MIKSQGENNERYTYILILLLFVYDYGKQNR